MIEKNNNRKKEYNIDEFENDFQIDNARLRQLRAEKKMAKKKARNALKKKYDCDDEYDSEYYDEYEDYLKSKK